MECASFWISKESNLSFENKERKKVEEDVKISTHREHIEERIQIL